MGELLWCIYAWEKDLELKGPSSMTRVALEWSPDMLSEICYKVDVVPEGGRDEHDMLLGGARVKVLPICRLPRGAWAGHISVTIANK